MARSKRTPEEHSIQGREALDDAAQITFRRILMDQQRVSTKLVPLLQYIGAHLFDSDLNVNRLKQACGIRDNSVAIRFHREIGLAPKAYIAYRRLETAARLLIHTELRAWEIAELTGYSGLGVFSKAFHRWAGQRPNAYRRQIRDLDARNTTAEPSPPLLLKRAVSGQLQSEEARWLIERLLELYPEVRIHLDGDPEDRG